MSYIVSGACLESWRQLDCQRIAFRNSPQTRGFYHSWLLRTRFIDRRTSRYHPDGPTRFHAHLFLLMIYPV